MNTKKEFLTKPIIICLIASICCILWGSAFPVIKIGYNLFNIVSNDTASQLLFAGYRFTLAGILAIIIFSIFQKKLLVPKKESIPAIFKLSIVQTSSVASGLPERPR